jgi:hypothetical protein
MSSQDRVHVPAASLRETIVGVDIAAFLAVQTAVSAVRIVEANQKGQRGPRWHGVHAISFLIASSLSITWIFCGLVVRRSACLRRFQIRSIFSFSTVFAKTAGRCIFLCNCSKDMGVPPEYVGISISISALLVFFK